ncbi:MAG: hypothetical protein ACOX5W_05320 [Bacillota bacterium]
MGQMMSFSLQVVLFLMLIVVPGYIFVRFANDDSKTKSLTLGKTIIFGALVFTLYYIVLDIGFSLGKITSDA